MNDLPVRAAPHHATRPIDAAHPAFAGHFPGRPLLPGVCLLAEVIEAALAAPALAGLLGPAPRLAAAKFLAPVGPGATLDIALVPGTAAASGGPANLDFEVRDAGRLVARGQFAAGEATA